jgi:hypothetical protein
MSITNEELERKLQLKNGVIDKQIEVLDEYRQEINRLNGVIKNKERIIFNLQQLVNEQNRMVHRTAQKD